MSDEYTVISRNSGSKELYIEGVSRETLNNRLTPDEVGNCYYGRTDNLYFISTPLGILDILPVNAIIVIKGTAVDPIAKSVTHTF